MESNSGSRISARTLLSLAGELRDDSAAYEALAERIRLLIVDGRIPVGTRLPSERELAVQSGRSRTTIVAAYQSLRDSGHVLSRQGSGSRVTLPRLGRQDYRPSGEGESYGVDFARAVPPPVEGLAEIIADASASMPLALGAPGFDLLGTLSLRSAIADRYTSRGLPTTADQIIVTMGAQHAISLTAHTLLTRSDVVLVESPTYPHAYEAMRRAGARLIATPVTTSGWEIEHLIETIERMRPALAYLIPDFHNPTGASMQPEDRVRVTEAARAAGTILVVDETTADLSIDRPWDDGPFARHARGASPFSGSGVVTVGSLSKAAWAGLRIGWIRADAALIRRFVQARPAGDLGTPQIEQLLAERIVRALPELLPRRREQMRVHRDALHEALSLHLPEWHVPLPDGGLSMWVHLAQSASSAMTSLSEARGLALVAGPKFSIDGSLERFLRVPFTAPIADLEAGTRILADSWAQLSARDLRSMADTRLPEMV